MGQFEGLLKHLTGFPQSSTVPFKPLTDKMIDDTAKRIWEGQKMSAEPFDQYQDGKNVSNAFKAAVAKAQHDRGHEGYTGTIAEKCDEGYIVISKEPVPPDEAKALVTKNQSWNHVLGYANPAVMEKWGPCGAIAVGPSPFKPAVGWWFFGMAST